MELTLYSDADWAGDKSSKKSTSGVYLCLTGPNTFMPLAGISKKQTSVSQSTPEAEIVAANMAIKTEGLPALSLWEVLLGYKKREWSEDPLTGERFISNANGVKRADQFLTVHFKEDNDATIKIVESGKNPTMRHMSRTHGICMAWLHERFREGEFSITYCKSNEMCADIFTKHFTDAVKWNQVCKLIGIFKDSDLPTRGVAAAPATKVDLTTHDRGA